MPDFTYIINRKYTTVFLLRKKNDKQNADDRKINDRGSAADADGRDTGVPPTEAGAVSEPGRRHGQVARLPCAAGNGVPLHGDNGLRQRNAHTH